MWEYQQGQKKCLGKGIRFGKIGVLVREEECYRCGKVWHEKNECRGALRACFKCGETEQLINECKKKNVVKCYQCGIAGYIASGCRSNHKNMIYGDCGKNAHYARMCRKQRAKCTGCGVDRHIAMVCRKRELSKPGYSGN
ncbi:CCHC-type zinc finger nucleic acid binding protein-like [Palaemon carinicauda]|uniref:CCHC-type zinc finger nucleic acid binding protein-like n=1 Tax=Palaemon carinicauda TaxID=392227 RepID=UPI0035B611FC